MTTRSNVAELAARMLRQRVEMGDGDLMLDTLSRPEALRLLREARGRPSAADASVSSASSGTGAGSPSLEAAPLPGGSAPSATAPTRSGASPSDPPSRPGSISQMYRDLPTTAPEKKPAPGAAPPVLPDDYDALKEIALGCTRCGLSETRTQVVFSDGSPTARLMVVGEAPGANEDASGVPFVGAAGRFLDLLLATVDLSREESVYIANVLKCRPPGNRNPLPKEIDCCSPYLHKQIELVRPEAILAVGTFSGQLLTGQQKTLGRLRGTVHSYRGVPLVVTYHPAALLRNAKWTRPVWDDLQLLRGILDGG